MFSTFHHLFHQYKVEMNWPVLLILFFTIFCSARRRGSSQYRTAYACEGRDLNITCRPGYRIHLIRANYGRFSIALCNENGALHWSVDCMSRNSFRVMQDRCAGSSSCTVEVSSKTFGDDPCPETFKYLEVHYICGLDIISTTTSRRPFPPIIFPNTRPPDVKSTTEFYILFMKPSSTIAQSSSPPPTTTTTTPTTIPTTVLSELEPKRAKPVDIISLDVSPTKLVTVSPSKNATTKYCLPVTSRGLFWNWTRVGEIVEKKCPDGAHGTARWSCSISTNDWYPRIPSLGNCSSLWYGNFIDRMHGVSRNESVVNVAEDLARRTTKRRLYAKDIIEASFVLKGLVSATKKQPYYYSYNQQRELMQALMKVVSNLLDKKQTESYQDLTPSERRFSASIILENLEENALSLAETQRAGDVFTHAEENVLAFVQIVKSHQTSHLVFPQPQVITETMWRTMEDSVYVPSSVMNHYSRYFQGHVWVVFMAYNNMENMLQSQSLLLPFSLSQDQQETVKQVVNSRIVSVSFGNTQPTWLPEPVIITLSSLRKENVSDPQCVFWDFETSDWSSQGCSVVSFNISHTVCSCNHLTNFAVLMTIKPIESNVEYNRTLLVITYVGCVISILSLLLTTVTFLCIRTLQNDRTTIHKNLCVCLLVAEVLFIAGINQTTVRVVCGIVAGLLHYFFLASFVWMFLEGFHLYIMLVEVLESEQSRMKCFYLVGYGVPAIVVLISAAVDSQSYGTDQYCWLKADNYFVFSFVGPVIAVLLASMVFLSIAVYIMCRHGNLMPTFKTKEQTKLWVWIRGAMVLVVLLGLTWAFGLLYLNEESVIIAYVFTVLNSLQGLFIFFFHCVRNEKVQEEYQKLIHQSQWLPKCLCNEDPREQCSSVVTSANTQPVCPHSSSCQSWVTTFGCDKPLVTSALINRTQDPETPRRMNQGRKPSQNSSGKFQQRNSLGMHSVDEVLAERSGRWAASRSRRPIVAGNVLENPMKTYDLHQLCKGNIILLDVDRRLNPLMDHIYETIDSDRDSLSSHKLYPPSVSQHYMSSNGQIKSNYSPGHQSTSSFVCDQRPLIPNNLEDQKTPVTSGHISGKPNHCSLQSCSGQVSYPRPSPTDSDNSSCSSSGTRGNGSSSTVPVRSITPSSEFSDGQSASVADRSACRQH
ncbi:adhesion G protein-coupled receptor L3-like isoform X3 [Tachypleus tridentatus]|uniref:adhesion G protein-coupled receptor L3-like isoform X3 n=1 Tax=Tachypleus tridentatus TaxID=6853 RepID=UPI003FD2B938